MGARSKARKRAVDLLFEADQRGLDPAVLLAERLPDLAAGPTGRAPTAEYTRTLVEGVRAHASRIDELLSTYSHGWSLERMPAVDRAILRLAAWELLFNDEVPHAVAIDEAVLLAGTLSTEDSPRFVNGLLARLLEVGTAS
jgi:N utilization substance protein B